MTLLERPDLEERTPREIEVLFKEARRRRRRRRILASGGLVVALALVLVLALTSGMISTPSHPPTARGPASPLPGTGQRHPSSTQAETAAWGASGALTAVSCSGSTCVSAGYTSAPHGRHAPRILYSSDAGGHWLPGAFPDGVGQITAVTCSSRTLCLAVGNAASRPARRGGLILKSSNGGQTWSRATLPSHASSFTDVACPSSNVCLATASPRVQPLGLEPSPLPATTPLGPVLYVSTDAASQWTPVATPPGVGALSELSCGSSAMCMAVGPGAAGTPQQPHTQPWIVASEDGGSTWSEIRPPVVALPSDPAVDAELLPTSLSCFATDQCLIAGVIEGTKAVAVVSTTNAGATWTAAVDAGLSGPDSFHTLPGLVDCSGSGSCVGFTIDTGTGEMGAELSSSDGGLTWQHRVGPSPTNSNGATVPGGPVDALWCKASSCVAAGSWTGYLSTARSTDAGSTWSSADLPVALSRLSSVSCWSQRECMAVGSTATGAALGLVTSDAGRRWVAASLPAGIPSVEAVSCPAHGRCTALATEQYGPLAGHSYVLRTSDAGRTWGATELPGSLSYTALSCWSEAACVAVGSASPVVNNGTAALITSDSIVPIRLPAGSPALVSVSCPRAHRCVAVSTSLILNGTNVGASTFSLTHAHGNYSWKHLGHIPSSFAVDPPTASPPEQLHCVGAGVCYLATQRWGRVAPPERSAPPPQGAVLVSVDSGRTWHVGTRAPRGDTTFAGVACGTSSACLAVGQAESAPVAAVIKTSDAGRNWHNVPLPGGVGSLTSATCVHSDHCFAVGRLLTSAGLLVSQDGGSTWTTSTLPAWIATSDTLVSG